MTSNKCICCGEVGENMRDIVDNRNKKEILAEENMFSLRG